jgi:hypothetical protein
MPTKLFIKNSLYSCSGADARTLRAAQLLAAAAAVAVGCAGDDARR